MNVGPGSQPGWTAWQSTHHWFKHDNCSTRSPARALGMCEKWEEDSEPWSGTSGAPGTRTDFLHLLSTRLSGKKPSILKPSEKGDQPRLVHPNMHLPQEPSRPALFPGLSSPECLTGRGQVASWDPSCPPHPPPSHSPKVTGSPQPDSIPTFTPPQISSTSIAVFVKTRNTFIESTMGCAKPRPRHRGEGAFRPRQGLLTTAL